MSTQTFDENVTKIIYFIVMQCNIFSCIEIYRFFIDNKYYSSVDIIITAVYKFGP